MVVHRFELLEGQIVPACECGEWDPEFCTCFVSYTVRCLWADGTVSYTDRRAMQKYLERYGDPTKFRFEVLSEPRACS